jgi:protein-S-isoprenylcysteine O-methyltransferase Ste14
VSKDRLPRSTVPSVILMMAVCGVILFGPAGRLDIIEFWVWLAVVTAMCVTAVLSVDPGLVQERARPGGKPPAKSYWLVTLYLVLALALAGLDRGRFHWSDGVPLWLRIMAMLLFAIAWVPLIWAMRVNRFFSSALRIQRERGQHVITDGPYRFVRHPGYTSSLVVALTCGVALGSWLAAVLLWVGIPMLVWRTVIEERMLRTELPSYTDYAARVKWRLLPGVW